MISKEQLQGAYEHLFNNYKGELLRLGVDVKKLSEKTLIKWFNNHLKYLEGKKSFWKEFKR